LRDRVTAVTIPNDLSLQSLIGIETAADAELERTAIGNQARRMRGDAPRDVV
jgi:hypothetical protein